MTTIHSGKRSEKPAPKLTANQIKVVVIEIVLVCVLFMVILPFFLNRNQPEKVNTPPVANINGDTLWSYPGGFTYPGVFHGQTYTIKDDPKTGSAIVVTSSEGKNSRALVQESPSVYIKFAHFANGHILYGVAPRPRPIQRTVGGVGYALLQNPRNLGMFLALSQSPDQMQKTQETRRSLPPWRLYTESLRIHTVPEQGGTPQDVPVHPYVSNGVGALIFGTNGNDVFWLDPRPDDVTQIDSGNATRTEITGHSRLTWASLSNGATRVLRVGLPSGAYLHPCSDGICWAERRSYPDSRIDIYRMRASDARPRLLRGGVDKLFYENSVQALEVGGYLAWRESESIFTVKKDDVASQPSVSIMPLNKKLASQIAVWRDSLYFVCVQPPSDEHDSSPPFTLCRLRPQKSNHIEVVRAIPGNLKDTGSFQFQEGYIYFETQEEHQGMWAWLTDDQAQITTKTQWYRLRLPE